jgi:hypothetical protein
LLLGVGQRIGKICIIPAGLILGAVILGKEEMEVGIALLAAATLLKLFPIMLFRHS